MRARRLILRSLWFHARSHLGTGLGAAIAAAVLIGALVVGDSVRESLHQLALARLGRVEAALFTGDRLFRSELLGAGSVAYVQLNPSQPGQPVIAAPALQLPAVAVAGGGSARANDVRVHGVDPRFWTFATTAPPWRDIAPGSVVLNEPLAAQLRVNPGDEILLRVMKPSALSRDAPLAPEENTATALRLRVQAVARDRQFGRFSLAANQSAPFNAFMALTDLQARLDLRGRANLIVAGLPSPTNQVWAMSQGFSVSSPTVLTNVLQALNLGVRQRWRVEDAELEMRPLPPGQGEELRTRRVFLDSFIAPQLEAAVAAATNPPVPVIPEGVLTYFVNELKVGDRATPYSMVTAAGPQLLPTELHDDEILINAWLAEDLGAKAGDALTLDYYAVGPTRALIERTASFKVKGVYPLNTPGIDRTLMPDFPGMTDAANCRDWDTGLPIKTDRIRPKDEEYWRDHRGTPKALITLAAGQKLWANRFGNLTAIRFAARSAPPASTVQTPARQPMAALPMNSQVVGSLVRNQLDPAAFGLSFQPVREQALAASEQSQDFGGLFIGFSLFLIAAALLLVHLLFQFAVESRAAEVGTLLATGFSPGHVRRLLLAEGALVALLGTAAGAWGGVGYARAMIRGLDTIWRDAIGGMALQVHVDPTTITEGIALAGLVIVGSMWFALRRQAAQPARALLASGAELESLLESGATDPTRTPAPRSGRLAKVVMILAGVGAIALVATGSTSTGNFFGAGALLLVAGLTAVSLALTRLATTVSTARLTLRNLALRTATRRRRRSLAVVALLASGSFLIAAIGVFRLDAVRGADRRASGTGGFALIGQASQPVVQDLDSAKGREAYGLDAAKLTGVSVVPMRVRDGDEASCLNLNRAQRPRLLGVAPDALAQRGAFTFAEVAKGLERSAGWKLLETGGTDPDEIPAIGDQASIQWALGKRIGDTIPYTDGQGRTIRLRLVGAVANSILQGSLVIAESEFVRRFPNETGYRMFLVDAPSNAVDRVTAELTRGLQDLGLELTPASTRLAAFNAVQNTYLGTFQVLGGLGLLLGSAGLGVVVLRHVLERRGEFALLLAVGWEPARLRRLVLIEHGALLAAGLALGIAAGAVAVMPAWLGSGTPVPYRSLGLTLAAVLANGWLWTWLATQLALRGRLLDALRNS